MAIFKSKLGIAYLALWVAAGVFFALVSLPHSPHWLFSLSLGLAILGAGVLIFEAWVAIRRGIGELWTLALAAAIIAAWYVLRLATDAADTGVLSLRPSWSFYLIAAGIIVWCALQLKRPPTPQQ